MALEINHFADDFDPRFKVFHELMLKKVRDILLVSSLYDACIMEEDCRLAERINNEYKGLNLSQPPRLTWVSSAEDALSALDRKWFDLVITMPRLADMNAFKLGEEVKSRYPDLPVILLSHSALPPNVVDIDKAKGIDRSVLWSGDADFLLALVKNVEDRMNVRHDTKAAGVRVILFVEDSPEYFSTLLPILYREVVTQTQAVLEEGLNEEHRLLTMRARAKILVAQSYEEAVSLYEEFEPFILGVISDVSFPRNGEIDDNAGIDLLTRIRREVPDMPLLLTSSETSNSEKARNVPAMFIDKNSPSLSSEIHHFFLSHLGFGDFVFRKPNGEEVCRVSSRRSLEKTLPTVPDESFFYHWSRNDFSRWLFARSEILLGSRLRPVTAEDFEHDVDEMREYLINTLKARRKWRQKGVVVDFDGNDFDPETEFLKIGKGSLGGKARGLAFVSTLLQRNPDLHQKFNDVDLIIPHTLVITTEGFDSFVNLNGLKSLAKEILTDEEVAERFLKAEFPEWLVRELRIFLSEVNYPLAIRSSGLLEDAQFRAYAGLYRTYMIPNDGQAVEHRLEQLITAVKLVYASTYYTGPKAFARRVGQRTEDEKMAVIIQELIGREHNEYFYPALSGVGQSHNYYPFDRMKPEEGIVTIALGLGKTVVEGGKSLRFSPKYPQLLPAFSTVEDMLENSQRSFYALKVGSRAGVLSANEDSTLERKSVSDSDEEPAVKMLASTYIPEEHRIKDTTMVPGHRIITFAQVLKYKAFPLGQILSNVLELGHEGMACPVELEFSVDLFPPQGEKPKFAFLQLRPMTARAESTEVEIREKDLGESFCFSTNALGNTERNDIRDILFVKPDALDPARTRDIAEEIGRLNAEMVEAERQYLLIGPGRWGSSDRWLGIPVTWTDISGVGAMVETMAPDLKAEPSQGSHFFHNVTTLGISYLCVSDRNPDFIHWDWLTSLPREAETEFMAHVTLDDPITLKVDGRTSRGAILTNNHK